MPNYHYLHILILLAAWLLYFGVHSLLASLWVKQKVAARWPGFMPRYRLVFNVLAVLLLLPIFWVMEAYPWPQVWQWRGLARILANGLALLAALGFVWSLRYYDMQEFIGIRQWRGRVTSVEEQEHLKISPLHRFVRHPWYFFAMIILWTRGMNLAQLILSVMVSLYFVVGSRLEERKLIAYYGERYKQYMQRVPGLFPWRGRALSKEEAEGLEGRV